VASLITHGHLDHTFSVKPLADGYGIPAYIHTEDRDLLLHPQAAHGAEFIRTLEAMEFVEPKEVKNLRHGDEIQVLDM
jgi:glyoxylase-like metal-dependent hydrolase (beta-lactamase superfamily II)